MPTPKTDLEGAHERLFLKTLFRARRHAGVEIPDVPAVGDRHVAGIGLAIDESEAVLAEQAVVARIVDETRDKEQLLAALGEVTRHRLGGVDACQARPRMRAARADDHGE